MSNMRRNYKILFVKLLPGWVPYLFYSALSALNARFVSMDPSDGMNSCPTCQWCPPPECRRPRRAQTSRRSRREWCRRRTHHPSGSLVPAPSDSCAREPGVKISVVDPDPHSFGCPGSGSVLVMRIQIREHGNWPKLTNNPVPAIQKGFCTSTIVGMFLTYRYYRTLLRSIFFM